MAVLPQNKRKLCVRAVFGLLCKVSIGKAVEVQPYFLFYIFKTLLIFTAENNNL